jgi:hypothetical protein
MLQGHIPVRHTEERSTAVFNNLQAVQRYGNLNSHELTRQPKTEKKIRKFKLVGLTFGPTLCHLFSTASLSYTDRTRHGLQLLNKHHPNPFPHQQTVDTHSDENGASAAAYAWHMSVRGWVKGNASSNRLGKQAPLMRPLSRLAD